jgi:hypothetical protein
MTKRQRVILSLLAAERAYVVRIRQRRTYVLVGGEHSGRRNDITLAVFRALRPHLDPQTVRAGEILPDGSSWKNLAPTTIWKVAG